MKKILLAAVSMALLAALVVAAGRANYVQHVDDKGIKELLRFSRILQTSFECSPATTQSRRLVRPLIGPGRL